MDLNLVDSKLLFQSFNNNILNGKCFFFTKLNPTCWKFENVKVCQQSQLKMEGKLLADCKMFACVCLDYYWNLDEKNINSDEAILSEMLEFRKQPMFRLGFRNGRETQVVSFSSMNHHSTGTNLLFITLKINEDNPVMMIAKKFRDLRVQTYSFNVPDRLENICFFLFFLVELVISPWMSFGISIVAGMSFIIFHSDSFYWFSFNSLTPTFSYSDYI